MKIHIVNAFAEGPASGNPAAVCVLKKEIPDETKQKIAFETGCSDTAFLAEGENAFALRWFTPTTEVDLCGHATLAGAHLLWELGSVPTRDEIRFSTKSGILAARNKGGLVEMDFPCQEPWEVEAPETLSAAVPHKPLYVGRNESDHIVLYESEEIVRNAAPEPRRVKELGSRGLIITAVSGSARYDFVSRFFAPNVGIDEDPVTGSAHCCLCPFWSRVLGKKELVGYQASERGGVVRARLLEDGVLLAGKASTATTLEISAHGG